MGHQDYKRSQGQGSDSFCGVFKLQSLRSLEHGKGSIHHDKSSSWGRLEYMRAGGALGVVFCIERGAVKICENIFLYKKSRSYLQHRIDISGHYPQQNVQRYSKIQIRFSQAKHGVPSLHERASVP